MTEYKLYYFNVTGLAEPIRFLFHYCGVEFEDVRFQDFEEWKSQYQEQMPMKQVPVLEINGTEKLHQHIAICRYLAKKFNLCGSNEEEDRLIDQVVYDINDMRLTIANYYNEKNFDFKVLLKRRMLEKLPFTLEKLDELAKKNDMFFVRDNITWAEVYYAGICEVMSNILDCDINNGYPSLKKLVANVCDNDRIKAYIEKRPETFL